MAAQDSGCLNSGFPGICAPRRTVARRNRPLDAQVSMNLILLIEPHCQFTKSNVQTVLNGSHGTVTSPDIRKPVFFICLAGRTLSTGPMGTRPII
jgi:hypothetical protein